MERQSLASERYLAEREELVQSRAVWIHISVPRHLGLGALHSLSSSAKGAQWQVLPHGMVTSVKRVNTCAVLGTIAHTHQTAAI